ncbi:MAG: hypothetical protein GF335_03275 [Candidatus Moranbacteria bacterium]|nr:hypothetical protein [Candidatus Moranbacteria bacterium]
MGKKQGFFKKLFNKKDDYKDNFSSGGNNVYDKSIFSQTDDLNIKNKDVSKAKKNKPFKILNLIKKILIVIVFIALFYVIISIILDYRDRVKIRNQKFLQRTQDFSLIVERINVLDTEKSPKKDRLEQNELYIEELKKELTKIKEAKKEIKKTLEKKDQNSWHYFGFDKNLEEFYQNALLELNEYEKFYAYEIQSHQKALPLLYSQSNLLTRLKISENNKIVARETLEFKKELDEALQYFKKLKPPEKLKNYHQKSLYFLEKYSTIVNGISQGLYQKDEKNSHQYQKSIKEYRDFINSDRSIEELEELWEFYFEKMHLDFKELRQEADDIKSRFIYDSAYLGTQSVPIYIEAW